MPPLAGWQYGILERLALNAGIGSATSYWKSSLPILDVDRDLHGSSDTYRRNLCDQMWIDPDTPQSQAYVDMQPGYVQGAARISPDNHNWYIVDSSVPKREIRNGNSAQWSSTYDGANDQWATRMQDVLDRNGGFRVPLDVLQNQTPDKYVHVYDPVDDAYLEMYYALPTDMAAVTVSITGGTPTSGTFQLVLNYNDHINGYPSNFTTAAIPYNATSAQVRTAIENATSGTYGRLGHTGAGIDPFNENTGGPLPAPCTWRCRIATPNRAIGISVINSTLNAGTVTVSNHAAGPLDFTYGGSVLTPGGGRDGFSAFHGTFEDFIGNDGLYWQDRRWGGAATSIGYISGITSIEEAIEAQANDTGVDHAVSLLVGNAQYGNWLYPATRSDGSGGGNYIPEGARVTFPADVDLSAVESNVPELMWLARTIRDKGAIVYDKTGGGVEIACRASWFIDPDGTEHHASPEWADLLTRMGSDSEFGWTYMTWLPWHKAEIYVPQFSLPPTPVVTLNNGWRLGSL